MAGKLTIHRARLAHAPGLHDLVLSKGRIAAITASDPGRRAGGSEADGSSFEAAGRLVLPGFVDCHTHACFAGSRLDEWEQKLAGTDYLDLLGRGGGIMATVRATREASQSELAGLLLGRLNRMLAHGSTTIEVKSGYGLDTATELKMLRAIARAAGSFAGSVVPTACIGHAIDPDVDRETFVARTLGETLPAVSAEFPGITLDAYCERGAWSLDDCIALFEAGLRAGHPARVHADQFNALGMIEAAVERGFASVDHLEATGQAGLSRLAQSETFGVMLPASGFHLDDRYGDGRAFLDAGGKLALATNYNPGSAPCGSMTFIVALAVRKLGLTPAEALHASTAAGAELLGLADRGRIEPGMRADLVVYDCHDARELAFEFGANRVCRVLVDGRFVEFES